MCFSPIVFSPQVVLSRQFWALVGLSSWCFTDSCSFLLGGVDLMWTFTHGSGVNCWYNLFLGCLFSPSISFTVVLASLVDASLIPVDSLLGRMGLKYLPI